MKKFVFLSLFLLFSAGATWAAKADAFLQKGNDLVKEQKYEKAIEAYKQAIKENKKDVNAHLAIALAYVQLEKYSKALDYAEKAVEMNSTYQTYYHLGSIYALSREPQKAIEAYDKALKLSPGSHDAEFQKGLVYASEEKFEKAIEAYQKALEGHPLFTEARVNLAGAFYKTGRRDEALKQAEELRNQGQTDAAKDLEEWIQRKDQNLPDQTA